MMVPALFVPENNTAYQILEKFKETRNHSCYIVDEYGSLLGMTCTAAVESDARTLDDIINEIVLTRTSERGETRIDDKVSEAAMEDRKKNGYF